LHKLCEFWKKAHEEFRGKPFYEAVSVNKASLTDLMQYMIDQGVAIYGVEVEHGWSEIHSREDYFRVSEYFKSLEAISNAL
nr:hypothetical protein [Candidatus Omnitrophota bacterium]